MAGGHGFRLNPWNVVGHKKTTTPLAGKMRSECECMQTRYFPFGSSQKDNDDEPWYQRWNSICHCKDTRKAKLFTIRKNGNDKWKPNIVSSIFHQALRFSFRLSFNNGFYSFAVNYFSSRFVYALWNNVRIRGRGRGAKRYEFDYVRVIAVPCKGEEGQRERWKNNRKSIIILVIVFGIRFALFCYLPIHSITLSFVASSFLWFSHHSHYGQAKKYTHSIYTHILPPLTQTPTTENQEASKRESEKNRIRISFGFV